ncbi:Tn3 family transposase [Streptosporangium canum]|uniref:Tn3 family transposase n=1 Tax=Streptosporangium canum TaxID=324952 RepID=UPI00342C4769
MKLGIEKPLSLRGVDAHLLDMSMLPRERRRFLATLGRRFTVQGLERRGERRYPILLALRDGLRSEDVFVPGSRRYADPGIYLFTPEQWQPRLAEFCQLVREPSTAAEAIAQGLHQALTDLEETLASASPGDVGTVRLDEQGKLVIPPLSAEDIPAEAKALRDELASMLPFAPIASLLIELDARTSFLACFTHAGGRKSSLSVETKRNILAVLIADATDLGLTRMSEACGVSYATPARTQQWYAREATLREANTVIVNHHYKLEPAKKFGGGTMSSSVVAGCWPGLLRMGGSLKFGEATASLIVGKWSAASRQNTLAAALKEWGRMRRTIHAACHLSYPVCRRKISRQLNKGEPLHALRRDLHYAQQGTIVRPHLQDQTEQAWCLTLLTDSVICWTTEYYGMGIGELRGQGREVPDELLSFIAPGHRENINFFGFINVDIEAEPAKLGGGCGRCASPR